MNAEEIEAKVAQLMRAAFSDDCQISRRNDPGRVKKLRVSSFPFCGVQWFLNLPKGTAKSAQHNTGFIYYTSVGTAVHDTIQSAFSSMDISKFKVQMIADWECHACHKMQVRVAKPKACPHCGHKHFKFHEITVSSGSLVGHVDTVFEITLPKATKQFPTGKAWIVIDYKTSSMKKVGTDRMTSVANKSQIRAYVALLEGDGHYMIPFAVLVYIPRDDPLKFQSTVVPVDIDKEHRVIKAYKHQFKLASNISKPEDLQELVDSRPCQDKCLKQFQWCMWQNMCAGPENTRVISRELRNTYRRVEKILPIIEWNP